VFAYFSKKLEIDKFFDINKVILHVHFSFRKVYKLVSKLSNKIYSDISNNFILSKNQDQW